MGIKIASASAIGILVAVTLGAGNSQGSRDTIHSCGPVLEHEVCTWVVLDGAAPVELGATVPLALIESVPPDAPMTWPPEELAAVRLPVEARTSLGIDHLGINWEAHGHPPGPFMTPHFDFHFYNLTRVQVSAIDCSDVTKPPTLPSGYTLPDIDVPELGLLTGLCVPRMGMHAMPDEELEGAGPFGATMVMGYYQGVPVFFEPMVSRDLLLQRSDFELPVPPMGPLPDGVHYPTRFRAQYDEVKDEYRLIMAGFAVR